MKLLKRTVTRASVASLWRAQSLRDNSRRTLQTLLLLVAIAIAPHVVQAQERMEVRIVPPTLTTPGTTTVTGVLASQAFDKLLRAGFPVRVHVKAEMWRTRFLWDEIVATTDWDVIIKFDTFDGVYDVLRIVGIAGRDSIMQLGEFRNLADAKRAAEIPYAMALPTPPRGRESYISVQADVQTIEMSDLDELMRWLRGEASPAVRGEKNPGTVITRALRSVGSQLLGAEVRHLEGRTKPFKL